MCGELDSDALMFGSQQDDTVGSILDQAGTNDLKDEDFFPSGSIFSESFTPITNVIKRDVCELPPAAIDTTTPALDHISSSQI